MEKQFTLNEEADWAALSSNPGISVYPAGKQSLMAWIGCEPRVALVVIVNQLSRIDKTENGISSVINADTLR